MQIFLIRHPKPLIDLSVCYGRLDVDCVDPAPIAERLRPLLPDDVTVFSSPLIRARRLAEAIKSEVVVEERLAEIHFGEWEGVRWDDIDRPSLDAWAADLFNFTPPGGESATQLRERVVAFVESIAAQGVAQVALVTHAGVIRSLLAHWRQLSPSEWTRLDIGFGSLTTLEI